MYKVFLQLDNLFWFEYMYPAQYRLYKLTKPCFIRIRKVMKRK